MRATFAILLCFAAVACADDTSTTHPPPSAEQIWTKVQNFQKVIASEASLPDNSASKKFLSYIPSQIKDFVSSLTENEIVQAANLGIQKHADGPAAVEAAIQQEVPTLYQKLQNLLTSLKSAIDSIPDETERNYWLTLTNDLQELKTSALATADKREQSRALAKGALQHLLDSTTAQQQLAIAFPSFQNVINDNALQQLAEKVGVSV